MFKNIFFLLLLLVTSSVLQAQARVDTTEEAVRLSESVISATRSSQARTAVAQQVTVLRRSDIERLNAQTSADLIQNSGAAFVQKSQQGGGSPILRGFEASRVLLVVDGVRMNNAIYRAGHLQNIITMDNNALDRAEVLFGPASTLYGSDALGGAICFYTKDPTLAGSGEGFRVGASAFARYGTVNQEKTGHLDFNLGWRRFGALSSVTFSDFGDLRMGEREGSAPFFGRRDYYVERINGRDSLVKNSDPYVQKFSGYRQYDVLQKFVFQQNSRLRHTLNIQYSNSGDVPRYDRLTDPNANTVLNSAEWYYGPQERLMAAYTLQLTAAGWFNGGLRGTLSYQQIEESRHNRNFGAANRTSRIENLDVYGLTLEAVRQWGTQELRVGIDGQYNDVQSRAFRYNVNTGDTLTQSTRYPDGGSTMYNVAAFVTHQWRIGDKWVFNEGIRAGFAELNATFVSREFFKFPYTEANQQTPVVSGNLGAVWQAAPRFRVAVNASTGFRVPNVDDLTKIFDSQKGTVYVPNPDLKAEKTFNLDLNLTYQISGRLRWENVLWATAFRDAIQAAPFQFNGQDSALYDGVQSRVFANQNLRKAGLYGFSSGLEADVLNSLAVYGSVAYTKGEVKGSEGAADTPLDHIPPVYGRVGARWHVPKVMAEAYVLFNGKKPIDEYSPSGEDNAQYAPADGMPSWWTLNVRAGYRPGKHIQVQAGIDNLLDVQYRTFASGINGAGRNVFVTLRCTL
jgi:hemoglobin/transferrin/lactoferrin receptor protein